jgi:adenosylcobinamide-GDP ribazoletransferase
MAAVVVLLGVVVTRALHLDGLADWADGFGGRGDRAKTLAIMKDPHTGSFGIAAVVTVLLVKWVSLARCFESDMPVMLIAGFIVSRTMMAELASSLPYSRTEGGTAGPFVENAKLIHRVLAMVFGLALLMALAGPFVGAGSMLLGWIACRLFALSCKRRLGGVTGDTLGACSELVEALVLFCGAFCGHMAKPLIGW